MQYFIALLEGVITFISPCLLPMLPVYVSYFACGESDGRRTVKNALGFILGFTAVFTAMGALAGSLGRLLAEYKTAVNILTGLVVIIFGLGYLGLFQLPFFNGRIKKTQILGFFSSALFGAVFSIGWTPCVGAFLGSALLLATSQGRVLDGVLMLLCYSLGLGIPFLISALLIDRLKSAFAFIKHNYRIVNAVCGGLLILVGVLMATGLLSKVLTDLTR